MKSADAGGASLHADGTRGGGGRIGGHADRCTPAAIMSLKFYGRVGGGTASGWES